MYLNMSLHTCLHNDYECGTLRHARFKALTCCIAFGVQQLMHPLVSVNYMQFGTGTHQGAKNYMCYVFENRFLVYDAGCECIRKNIYKKTVSAVVLIPYATQTRYQNGSPFLNRNIKARL